MNALRVNTHTCIQALWTKAISRNQSRAWLKMVGIHQTFSCPHKKEKLI